MQDIMMGFSLRCDKSISSDRDFPLALRFFVDKEDTAKIILEVSYYPKSRFAEDKLNEISTIVEKTAVDYGIKLLDSKERPMTQSTHKLGGRGKEHSMQDDSMNCRQYRFIMNPDFTGEQYKN